VSAPDGPEQQLPGPQPAELQSAVLQEQRRAERPELSRALR